MRNISALLSILGIVVVWPYVLTKSVSSIPQAPASTSSSAELEEERPRVERSTMQDCDPGLESYCFNNGQCMLLLDLNEHHCKCERGYYGPRCAHVELVSQPMGEEQLVFVFVCVALLLIGLAGAMYFFCKWYRRNRCPRQQKRQGYQGVQTA